MGAYDLDFHAWLMAQADAIRRRSPNEIDWDNLAEEVEGLARNEWRSLRSYLILLCAHLLKWTTQPERRTRSWVTSIQKARVRIPLIIEDNPGFKPGLADLFLQAYELARFDAADDMHKDVRNVPTEPPFSLEQALGNSWPDDLVDWDPEWDA